MAETINGTCHLMCPQKERWMREREGLLHQFEIDEKTKHLKKPKADPNKIIKSYSRSAAGQVMTDPSSLRPGPVLLSTIKYLFTKIVTRTDVDWIHVYDFTFDRLRSIRQDLVIQRIGTTMSIQILEPIVRFHTYASQRLCERNINEFNSKINDHHLLECMTQLLVLYDTLNREGRLEIHEKIEAITLIDNRVEMETLYILLNIGNLSGLNRALILPKKLRNSEEIKLATKISIAWYLKNYVRVFRLIEKLRPIFVCAVMCNLKSLRRNVLQIMSSGYNSKNLTFPGLKLQELLLYKDIEKLKKDCEIFNLQFINENVLFQKTSFNNEVLLANSEMYYTPQKLHKFLPNILLGSS
ncbi:PREDICTED: germinal-center associated nuclear protein [Polistes dominula]|uniref:Germinal-center associated nuclear protein n=1 Tax=Polistes dominula TaxID=743375 RepID=A0ABM1ILF3_POLDO|nr:PREDICTED: germinal-center associated nuclear protein [Polistes dominula]XP_015181041.1 PREDICTED: germinal-center associated nuclear protein [Polistes dominula]